MNTTQRYIQLMLIGLVPSLSGCLSDFNLKAEGLEVEIEQKANEGEPEDSSSKDDESDGKPLSEDAP